MNQDVMNRFVAALQHGDGLRDDQVVGFLFLLIIAGNETTTTLIGNAVLTYVVGPFSGTLGLVQSINRVSTFRMSLWNAPYALGFLVLLSAASLLV